MDFDFLSEKTKNNIAIFNYYSKKKETPKKDNQELTVNSSSVKRPDNKISVLEITMKTFLTTQRLKMIS